jgi:predicted nucleotidyltransferase
MDLNCQIQTILDEIEVVNEVRVIYACESGSRAWGFASKDSDYDVRFLYAHPAPWYLSVDLEEKRNVIERKMDDVLDVSGWDIRKALRLFRKSNPPLLEWLGSPIIYREHSSAASRMRELRPTFYSPMACAYHYLHMAQGNFREYLKGAVVWRKKYFYVLRPILAIRWIEAGLGVVPTEFIKLVEATVTSDALESAIRELLEEKAAGGELDRGPRNEPVSQFIESELDRMGNTQFDKRPPTPPIAPLNKLFQDILEELFDTD